MVKVSSVLLDFLNVTTETLEKQILFRIISKKWKVTRGPEIDKKLGFVFIEHSIKTHIFRIC